MSGVVNAETWCQAMRVTARFVSRRSSRGRAGRVGAQAADGPDENVVISAVCLIGGVTS